QDPIFVEREVIEELWFRGEVVRSGDDVDLALPVDAEHALLVGDIQSVLAIDESLLAVEPGSEGHWVALVDDHDGPVAILVELADGGNIDAAVGTRGD